MAASAGRTESRSPIVSIEGADPADRGFGTLAFVAEYLSAVGRPRAAERKRRNYLLREKRSGRFTRRLQLPPSYTGDPSEATFEHGVLRLVFPKAEVAKPRRIQIGGGAQQAMSSGKQGTE